MDIYEAEKFVKAMKPTISILLLCWNHASFLEECIGTLAAQTDRDFEIIFLDNVSTDGSFEIAAQLFEQFGLAATMIRNDRPRGISANNNRLFAHSAGSIVCPLSTDDWARPHMIQIVRQAATDHPEALWFFGPRASPDDAGELTIEPQACAEQDFLASLRQGELTINLNGGAYRREAIEEVGGWDEKMRVEDLDLAFRLALIGPFHRLAEPVTVYRSHPEGISKNLGFMIEGTKEFVAKHGQHFPRRGRTFLSESMRQMAAREIDLGRMRRALRLLATAFLTDPANMRTPRTMLYLARRVAGVRS